MGRQPPRELTSAPIFFPQVSTRSPPRGRWCLHVPGSLPTLCPHHWCRGRSGCTCVHSGACMHVCRRAGSPGRLEQLGNCLEGDRPASRDLWRAISLSPSGGLFLYQVLSSPSVSISTCLFLKVSLSLCLALIFPAFSPCLLGSQHRAR